MLKTIFLNKINLGGLLVAIILIFGFFGPWLTISYDSYAKINPVTKVGEAYYHSRVELNPIYASLYNDEILIERIWFITFGTSFAGLILMLTAVFSVFKYKQAWTPTVLFIFFITGLVTFFLSVGSGISIGVSTQIGWGLEVTGLAFLISFLVAFRELTRNSISRFVD